MLRFLLSNLRYWIDEFGFDGFRFDGVTSMLYRHHGLAKAFCGYDDYFEALDDDSVVYLMLAHRLFEDVFPGQILTVAEEVSGFPTLCMPLDIGGVGFSFRLGMAVPDMWIKLLKESTVLSCL